MPYPLQFLAISQWHIAAQQPPSLKAIAPWEGCGDLFRSRAQLDSKKDEKKLTHLAKVFGSLLTLDDELVDQH
jgi:predicted acyl esterase